MFLLVVVNMIVVFCHSRRGKFCNVTKELSTLCYYALLHHVDELPENFLRSNYDENLPMILLGIR